jgi:hypothetical protein
MDYQSQLHFQTIPLFVQNALYFLRFHRKVLGFFHILMCVPNNGFIKNRKTQRILDNKGYDPKMQL